VVNRGKAADWGPRQLRLASINSGYLVRKYRDSHFFAGYRSLIEGEGISKTSANSA